METQAHLAVFQEPLLEMLGSPYRLCRTSPKEGSLTAAKQPLLHISFLMNSEHCSGEMILHLDRGDGQVLYHTISILKRVTPAWIWGARNTSACPRPQGTQQQNIQ